MGRFRHLFLRGLRVCNSRPLRNLRGLVGPRVGPWRRRSLSSMTDPSPLYAGGVIAEVTRLSSLCASEAAAALAEGSCSAVQLLEACQARAEAMRWTNALLTELPVRARCEFRRRYLLPASSPPPNLPPPTKPDPLAPRREAAQASDDRRRENKSLGPLDGIPVVVKDNFCVEGSATTAGSRFLSNFIAPYTATGARKSARDGLAPESIPLLANEPRIGRGERRRGRGGSAGGGMKE